MTDRIGGTDGLVDGVLLTAGHFAGLNGKEVGVIVAKVAEIKGQRQGDGDEQPKQ